MTAFENVRAVYEKLGAEEPFYAVLTHDQYKGGVVDEDAFFATGEQEVCRQMDIIESEQVTVIRGRSLDFGCGVGRLTNALGAHFEEVVGLDVSSTMITTANRLRRNEHCSFVCNPKEDLSVFPDSHFDFIYSNITLQHIPMPASGNYLREFLRILKPDGLAICLIPDGKYLAEGSLAAKWDRFRREKIRPFLKRLRGKQPVQIHPIARRQVEKIVSQAGGEIIKTEITPDFVEKKCKHKPQFYWIRHAQFSQQAAA